MTWYKGNEVVHLDDRVTSEHAGNRHILLISRLRSEDVATYMCYTINELGSAQETIEFKHEDITEQSVENDEEMVDLNVESDENVQEEQIVGRDMLEAFKQKIESDLNTLRNLTYRAMSQANRKLIPKFKLN